MLSNQQQALVQAIQQLDLDQVQSLLAEGLDPNFIDAEHGFPVSIVCDGLFVWWENVCEAYEAGKPFTDVGKATPAAASNVGITSTTWWN